MVDLSQIRSLDCQNIGDGLGLYVNNTGSIDEVLGFKTLIGGPGIVLNADDQTITIEYVGMANGGAIPFAKIVGAPSSIAPLGLLYGTNDNRLDFIPAPGKQNVVLTFVGSGFQWLDVPEGTVTSVEIVAGSGLEVIGSTITMSGSFNVGLTKTGVDAGSYVAATIEVDECGRITNAKSSPIGDVTGALSRGGGADVFLDKQDGILTFRSLLASGNISIVASGDQLLVSSIGVTSVDIKGDNAIQVSGGPITSMGDFTIGLSKTGVQSGSYECPTILVDEQGRIVAAMSNRVGEIATARSLGSGAAVFSKKEGTEFLFRSIKTTGSVTSSISDDEISIGCDVGIVRIDVHGDGIIARNPVLSSSCPVLDLSLTQTITTPGAFERPSFTVGPDGRLTQISERDPEPIISIKGSPVVLVDGSHPTFHIDLARSPVGAGTYVANKITLDDYGRIIAIEETIGAKIAVEVAESLPEAPSVESPLRAGIYKNPVLTVGASGSIADIHEDTPDVIVPSVSGVSAGYYENPSLTIDVDGRITHASSSASSMLPKAGNENDVLTVLSGMATWAARPQKAIPPDLKASRSWRLKISKTDGSGQMAIKSLAFRSTVGGATIPLDGSMICDDAGWGSNVPMNAFLGAGMYVSGVDLQSSPIYIGYHFDNSVVVREFQIHAGISGYSSPTEIELQFSDGTSWTKAWSITTHSWALDEQRAFSCHGVADEAFRTLADTPDSYFGHALKHVRVNQDETGLEFTSVPRRFGHSYERPDYHDQDIGVIFFDTDLCKPIWWSGTKWVDAGGDTV